MIGRIPPHLPYYLAVCPVCLAAQCIRGCANTDTIQPRPPIGQCHYNPGLGLVSSLHSGHWSLVPSTFAGSYQLLPVSLTAATSGARTLVNIGVRLLPLPQHCHRSQLQSQVYLQSEIIKIQVKWWNIASSKTQLTLRTVESIQSIPGLAWLGVTVQRNDEVSHSTRSQYWPSSNRRLTSSNEALIMITL